MEFLPKVIPSSHLLKDRYGRTDKRKASDFDQLALSERVGKANRGRAAPVIIKKL